MEQIIDITIKRKKAFTKRALRMSKLWVSIILKCNL